MHRTRLLPVLLLLLSSLGAAQSTKGSAAEIEQLQVKREGSDVRIEVILTGAVQPAVETATNPDRLVLTLPGTLSDAKQKHFPLDANGVHGVRVGLNNANPPVTRVVVDMDSAHPYTVETNGKTIVVHVQPTDSAVASKHSAPVPAASAPLIGMFHRKPPTPPAADENAAQPPIPVPAKLPPINFPEKQPTAQASTSVAPATAAPSATHPKLGSLQQGTVFPGMGTPGAGSAPIAKAQNANTQPAASNPLTVTVTQANNAPAGAPAVTTGSTSPASTPAAASASTTASAQHVTSQTAAKSTAPAPTNSASPSTPTAPATASALTPATATTAVATASSGSTTSSAGAPNVTAKVMSATVNTPAANSTPTAAVAASTAPASQPSQPATPSLTSPATTGVLASQPAPVTSASPAPISTSAAATPPATLDVTPEAADATPELPATQEAPAALALRATHPDFRTNFKIKYVAEGVAYLDGGRSAGLTEGMKLVVRDTPTASVASAADGNADNVVAELEVMSVADASAVTDIHTPKRDVKAGDLAYLSSQDEQSLVQENTLSATRKYPTVISFTDADALDDEARAEVPRPPVPSINRARGRIGFDYMGTAFRGSAAGMNSDVGLVARMDMTRIGGTYWNLSGYWRGNFTANSAAGSATIQDLINRTYHIAMTYDSPSSALVAGFGRLYLPWASSLDTIDGGYVGVRLNHVATMGVFGGSTPDPTSYSYNPNQRIAGTFVNFTGGNFDGFRYTSTVGAGVNTVGWQVTRPFLFYEGGVFYKRSVSIYDSVQIDNPVGYAPGTTPGTGVGRTFTTIRYQPHERIEFNANYNYFRDIPTFDPTLIGTGLLDKYLFQGFSAGVRVEALKQVWLYTTLGSSNRSGDTSTSLNQLYGITFGRLPWKMRADAHYSKFNSSFGNGYYDSVSLSRNLNDNFRIEVLAGQQNFTSSFSSNNNAKFVTGNLEMNMGLHYFIQGGFTANRGATQDYDQWIMTLGYRFDSRQRAKVQ